MMSAYNKPDKDYRRHGLVVKKDASGDILLGNGNSIAIFEDRIKSYKPIAELSFIKKVKCIEFNGEFAPGKDCHRITRMIKALVFQYGSTIEQVYFYKIDIDMEGMAQIISACPNLHTLIFYRAGVKYIIKHRIQHHFWLEIKRNHTITNVRFIECDSIATSTFIEALHVSKHPGTRLDIKMEDPTSGMDLTYIEQFEEFAKEAYRPREGLSINVDLAEWGCQLQAKADAIEDKPWDKEHILERKEDYRKAVARARAKLQRSIDGGIAATTLLGVSQALVVHRHSFLFLKEILKQRPELFQPPPAASQPTPAPQPSVAADGDQNAPLPQAARETETASAALIGSRPKRGNDKGDEPSEHTKKKKGN